MSSVRPMLRLRRPRRVLPALAVLLAAACGGGDGADDGPVTPPRPPSARGDTVFSLPLSWSPTQVTISVGGYVAFVFQGGIDHNALFRANAAAPRLAGAPDDIPITRNAVVTRTFERAGTYPVTCTVHPGMNATVVVQP